MSAKTLLPLTLLAWASVSSAQPCEFERIDPVSESLTDITRVELNALAGELEISGQSTETLSLESRACADTQKHLDNIRLDIRRDAGVLTVTVVMDLDDVLWDAEYAYADLVVHLPATMPVAIRDSSGDISLKDVSVASIDDSSGKITGRDLHGDMTVNDSSGDMRFDRVTGSITLTDSSGDIELRDINGAVTVRADGSGSIELTRISGAVEVGRDGSGDIDIDTAGPVHIQGDGSGEIVISNVSGGVYIGADGAGSIDVADITGDFTVDAKGSGHIRTRRISGKISIPQQHQHN